MIVGAKNWNNKDFFYSQENNAIESYNKTQRQEGLNHWTESCGPTMAVNCMAAMGYLPSAITSGGWAPQPEDVLFLYLNDPRNYAKLERFCSYLKPGDIANNRVIEYYPVAIYDTFSFQTALDHNANADLVIGFVSGGHAVGVCLKNPGHYIAIVAYDMDTKEFIYNDSFGSRFKDGLGGFNRRMKRDEFEQNVKPFALSFIGGK